MVDGKKIMSLFLTFVFVLSFLASANAYGMYGRSEEFRNYGMYNDSRYEHQISVENYPYEDLDQNEIDGLIFMREEEKLARDVYLAFYDLYGEQIFSNIAKSESSHTSAVKALLEKYDIEDPVVSDERGVFKNEELQRLYDQLIEQGSESLIAALKVGATIEDLDIKDLKERIELTDNQDIKLVYGNLERGSRNHLRAFTSSLEKYGEEYKPQYISEEYFYSIISSDMEPGMNENSTVQKRQGFRNKNAKKNFRNGRLNGNLNVEETQTIQENSKEESQNFFVNLWNRFRGWFFRH